MSYFPSVRIKVPSLLISHLDLLVLKDFISSHIHPYSPNFVALFFHKNLIGEWPAYGLVGGSVYFDGEL